MIDWPRPGGSVEPAGVLVVGASRGLGLSIATELAEGGSDVVVWSRSGDPGDTISAEIRSMIRFRRVDVRTPVAVADALRELERDGPRVDTVVYAVGIPGWGRVGQQATAEWRDVLETNTVGAFTVLDQFAKVFGQPPTRVVGIASDAARYAAAERSAYHAAKAALASFLESYRLEVRAAGTLVTVLYLGKVDTTFSARSSEASAAALRPAVVARFVGQLLAMPREVEIRSVEISSIQASYGP